ncbi:hypothetical protein, partial [Shewanella algae]|uniref:hypothetical protein n=1 Tax=Shewanella algae TaxID=38313 RepID=UPI001C9103B3
MLAKANKRQQADSAKAVGEYGHPALMARKLASDYALFKHLTRRLLCRALAELKSALKIRLTTI